ncbi:MULTISPECIES: type 4b pilus protein PilO2 [Achromobacter]|uniref:Type 4b pilus protein PilO2 n=1 Tax=Achromobacter denitrificans TaxID=32002 RepID=A0ABZ3G370_ACHDE|nr:type 4b pilus protein PilO2 [Achromobacter xylosoxidans]
MALRKKSARRVTYQLVAIPGSSNQLVLGIRWQTVLGEDPQKEALKLARKERATHYVQSDARSPSVGLLTAKGKESRAKTRASLFSGAAAFAQLHRHGTHLVAFTLSDDTVWLAVVADGVVQAGGDTIFSDPTAAQAGIDAAMARHRDLQVHSNYLPAVRPFSLQQLTGHANTQSSLRRATFSLTMVSPIWWLAIALILGYEAWDYGSSWWAEREARIQQQLKAQQPELDAAVLWKQAIAAWAMTARPMGETGLTILLRQIGAVPVEPGRWRLAEIDCLPRAGTCTAKYRRTGLADNHTLFAAIPSADWRVVHTDLDSAQGTWSIPKGHSLSGLKLQDLPTQTNVVRDWEPSWQALRPALQDFTLSPPAKVPISVPNIKLPNGLEQPVPMPAGMKVPASRALVINAPLRSLHGLSLPRTTEITQLQVRYAPDTSPGLVASAFSATLRGTIYVESP